MMKRSCNGTETGKAEGMPERIVRAWNGAVSYLQSLAMAADAVWLIICVSACMSPELFDILKQGMSSETRCCAYLD